MLWGSAADAVSVFVFLFGAWFLLFFSGLFRRMGFCFGVFRQEKWSGLAAGRKHHQQEGAGARQAGPESLAGTVILEGLIPLRLRYNRADTLYDMTRTETAIHPWD